jgi:hypothetical protein
MNLALLLLTASVRAATYDASFWEGLDAEEEPFEHQWTNIPDLIGTENVGWYFDMTHHFLTGISRGFYSNSSITLSPDCFGSRYVRKLNEFTAMIKSDWSRHWVLEIAIIYQLYYMWSDKCTIDDTIKDIYDFCWTHECTFGGFWHNTKFNSLYMSRALIDAAIVWVEGVPQEKPQWNQLSLQTGQSMAEIVKEVINYENSGKA